MGKDQFLKVLLYTAVLWIGIGFICAGIAVVDKRTQEHAMMNEHRIEQLEENVDALVEYVDGIEIRLQMLNGYIENAYNVLNNQKISR